MLERAIIVPDASALLGLYECNPEDRRRYLAAFTLVRGRLCVADRTRHEVFRRLKFVKTRNRVVIPHLARAFDHQIVSITKSVAQRKDIKPAYDTAATVVRVLMNQANLQLSAIADAILLEEYAAFSGVDDLLDKILMDGNSGSPLDAHDLERVLRTGINRFSNGIPPGYRDVHKLNNRPKADALGDLIFWEEILRTASCQGRPIIIVTAEEKEDWWHRDKGLRQPHPAMVSEMKGRSDQDFGCMHVDDFTSLITLKDEAALLLEFDGLQRNWFVAADTMQILGRLGIGRDYRNNATWITGMSGIHDVGQIFAKQNTLIADMSRSLGIGQSFLKENARIADISRNLGIGQSFLKENARIADISRNLGIGQSFLKENALIADISRNLGIGQIIAKQNALSADISRNLGIGQSFLKENARIADMSGNLGISQSFLKENARIADMSRSLGIGQSFLKENSLIADISRNLGIGQIIAKQNALSADMVGILGIGQTIPKASPLLANMSRIFDVGQISTKPNALIAALGMTHRFSTTPYKLDQNARRRARVAAARRDGVCTRCFKNRGTPTGSSRIMATCLQCREKNKRRDCAKSRRQAVLVS